MQSSPSSAQQLKQATPKSPATFVSPRLERSTSPRRDSAQVSSRSAYAHPALAGTLRMGSFYEIDNSFTRLREALKPGPKAARTCALPAVLDELQGAIKVSTLEAERAFTRRSYGACKLHLAAAKSNQVLMLGKIDTLADTDMPDDRRTGIRSACGEIGAALTRMLIQATTMENASAQEKILKQKARDSDSDSDSDDGPPSSPRPTERTPESHRNSPARSTQKRSQGDADSPVLAQSPGKRQKIDTASTRTMAASTTAADTTTRTTATATTTAAAPQSPPAYRPAPQLHTEPLASGARSVGSPSKPATSSSTAHASPQKMRTLSPQARPRPRSQLFVAPPDFTSQVRDDPAELARAAAPVQGPPGATPRNAVEGAQRGADS